MLTTELLKIVYQGIMTSSDWVQAYNQLNGSFKPKLVYRVGINAGFFSEYNHMVFAVAHCLIHKIRFVLSSRDNNFSIEKGWQDFFLPFCEETSNPLHAIYNRRGIPRITRLQDYSSAAFRYLIGAKYLTYQVLGRIRKQDLTERFDISELNLHGTFLEVCHAVVQAIWMYQPPVAQLVACKLQALLLAPTYVGMHIRGGDKVLEHKLFRPADYMRKLQELTTCQHVYVATDDYSNILALRTEYPTYIFVTNCRPSASGYVQSAFDEQSKATKQEALLDLFVDVDALSAATLFIGTYSSNVGMYLGMRRDASTCHCLDFDHWLMW